MLTTITPYWGRPDALTPWIASLKAATRPWLKHIIIFVGENPPGYWNGFTDNSNIVTHLRTEKPELSIGYYHNMGARYADSQWIMKLDVDVIPHTGFFDALRPHLLAAEPKEWYCCGMFHLSLDATKRFATPPNLPLKEGTFRSMHDSLIGLTENRQARPVGTQFICRREQYLNLGGCDERFRGYGWEDYYQIYKLERDYLGKDPLEGPIGMLNVTQRCRDEISRRKTAEIFQADKGLALIHRWHSKTSATPYRSAIGENKRILYEYIQQSRSNDRRQLFGQDEAAGEVQQGHCG